MAEDYLKQWGFSCLWVDSVSPVAALVPDFAVTVIVIFLRKQSQICLTDYPVCLNAYVLALALAVVGE